MAILKNTTITDTGSLVLPTATPGSLSTGMKRYNSSTKAVETYSGSSWVSHLPVRTYMHDGSTSPKAARSARAIKSLTGTTTDGLYWIDINGTPFEIYCDMNTDGGGWMLTFRNKNFNNQGCTQGTWDFPMVFPNGGSTTPTSPVGALSGLYEGFSPANRWSLWTSSSCCEWRATTGQGPIINLDVKQAGPSIAVGDNILHYACAGKSSGVPGAGYSNGFPGFVQILKRFGSGLAPTEGYWYQLAQLGNYPCSCCEGLYVGNWSSSTNGLQICGDGYGISNQSQPYPGEWTSYWIR